MLVALEKHTNSNCEVTPILTSLRTLRKRVYFQSSQIKKLWLCAPYCVGGFVVFFFEDLKM